MNAGLDEVRASPADEGPVALIAKRPAVGEREIVDEATLDVAAGLVGDTWSVRGSSSTPDGSANPEAQLTIMNSRLAALLAGAPERWPVAGDQVYADIDLSVANLPPGTRLRLGTAVIEISVKPHTGCAKFAARFGADALRFVNTGPGRDLRLRGVNARVVEPGTFRVGDLIRKVDAGG